MLDSNKIKEMSDEELLQEHQLYKEQLCRTMNSGKITYCLQTLGTIEVELDSRDIAYSKFVVWDFGDADWFKKSADDVQKYEHIIIDPKAETKMIGQLIRSAIQCGRDPSTLMLHLLNGDALQLNDLDVEKTVEVLNAMFGLQMTAEEYGSEGKYTKYFLMEEAPRLMTSATRKYNPRNQLKTSKQPFYRQLEKKKWY